MRREYCALKTVKTFIRGLISPFRPSWSLLRRVPLIMLFLLLINLAVYYLTGKAVYHWFSFFWVDPLLVNINDLFLPGIPVVPQLHRVLGEPLTGAFRPVLLIVALQAAFATATLFTGPVLTAFSRKMEHKTGLHPAAVTPRWYFYPMQELLLLCWTIFWSLIPLAGVLSRNPVLIKITATLYYITVPFLYGIIQLSYPLLDRGLSYTNILRFGMRTPVHFYGYSWGVFLPFLLLSRLSFTMTPGSTAAVFLFTLNALFRPLGILSAINYASTGQPLPAPEKSGIPLKALHTIAVAAAVAAVISAVQLHTRTRSKLQLFRCQYSGVHFRLQMPHSTLQLLAGGSGLQATLRLSISNRTGHRVDINGVHISLQSGQISLFSADINDVVLHPFQKQQLSLQTKFDPEAVIRGLFSGRTGKLRLRGTIVIPLWFGNLEWPLWK